MDTTPTVKRAATARASEPVAAEVLPALLHRLSTPLGTLVNTLFLLEEDPTLPASAREALDPLQRASRTLTQTLAEARRLLDAHDLPLDPARVDPAPLLTRAAEARGDVALTLRSEGATAVQACPEALRMAFDEALAVLAPCAGGEPLRARIRPAGAGMPVSITLDAAESPWAPADARAPIVPFESGGEEADGVALAIAATLLARMGGGLERAPGPEGGARLVLRLAPAEAPSR